MAQIDKSLFKRAVLSIEIKWPRGFVEVICTGDGDLESTSVDESR